MDIKSVIPCLAIHCASSKQAAKDLDTENFWLYYFYMNEHPLSQNFHDLSDDELDRKYNELTRRWHLAKRMQMDEYVLHQLDIMLNSIENEKWNRLAIPETDTNIVLETDPLPKTDGNKS